MQAKVKHFILIMTVLSCIVLSESLMTNALTNTIPDKEQYTPGLFHIGTFYLTINVSQTEFIPAEFTVKESTTVNLTIESIDIGHTFIIQEYDINETIIANTSVNIEFVADKLGSFTYSSVNSTATGTMIVTDPYVPDLPRPQEIHVLFDISHNTTNILDKFNTIYNWTAESKFIVSIFDQDQITSDVLEDVDILVILEPTQNFSDFELADILAFIRNGGSLLIGGSAETAFTNVYEITRPFGFDFSNATAMYINATIVGSPVGENNTLGLFNVTDFLSHPLISENQYVPLTDEIITKIQYAGALLNFNVTWAEINIPRDNLTDSEELVDTYVLAKGNDNVFADEDGDTIVGENETVGENNSLIVAAETIFNGRVFALGSADLFNNSMVGRNEENGFLYQRTIQWLAKMYAVLQSYDYTLETYSAKRGEFINSTLSVFSQNNTVQDAINVSLRIWRNQELQATVYLTTTNNTYFSGEINTSELLKGSFTVYSVAHKRGYGYNVTQSYSIEIYPAIPTPEPIPIPYLITYVVSIIIGIVAISFFFVRVLRAPRIVVEESEEIEDEELEEDSDLEEYEQ